MATWSRGSHWATEDALAMPSYTCTRWPRRMSHLPPGWIHVDQDVSAFMCTPPADTALPVYSYVGVRVWWHGAVPLLGAPYKLVSLPVFFFQRLILCTEMVCHLLLWCASCRRLSCKQHNDLSGTGLVHYIDSSPWQSCSPSIRQRVTSI